MNYNINSLLIENKFNELEQQINTFNSTAFSLSCVPAFFLLSVIFFYLTYSILMSLSKKKKFPSLKKHSLLIVTLTLMLMLQLNFLYSQENYFLYNTYFLKTQETTSLSMYICIVSILVLLVMNKYNEKENLDNMEYYTLLLSSIFALTILLESNEIISFFFILELQSISSYILAGFNKKYKWTLQSGIKYFIIGGVSSIFVIIGFIFFYSLTGSTSFEDLKVFSNNNYLVESNKYSLQLGIFFLTVGLFGKFYIAPFHWWIVDVYEGSPSTTTLYFSTVPLFSLFYVLYKIYFIFLSGYLDYYVYYFILGSYMSMFIGSIGALLQKRLKRLLAYSSINLLGYLLTIFISTHTVAFVESINLLIPYTINVVLLFAFFYNGNYRMLSFKKIKKIDYIEDFYLLRGIQTNTYNKYIFAIGLYGLLGLPPMPLFLQKFYLLEHLSMHGNWFLSFFFVLSSMISGYYYLYIIKELFYHKTPILSNNKKIVFSLSYNSISCYVMSILFFFQFYLILTTFNIF
jgi:NADH-quinone oxidoreductase subunit N